MLKPKAVLLTLSAFLASSIILAGEAVANWPAPATWSPPRSAGVHALADVTNPLPFVGLTPCRLVDTRGTGGVPINTGGKFSANEVRAWGFVGLCGVPTYAAAVSLNITVTDTDPNPFGFIKVWPASGTEPNVSTLNWSAGGVTVSNAAIVPGGSIFLRSGNAGSNVIVDINGYYASTTSFGNRLAPAEFFSASGTVDSNGVIQGSNNSSATASSGVEGTYTGTGNFTMGVMGINNSSAGQVYGVMGIVTSAGFTLSGTTNDAGVLGQSERSSGNYYGVYGISKSTSGIPAGVVGVDFTGIPPINPADGTNLPSGVLGLSDFRIAVEGDSRNTGVRGRQFNTAGTFLRLGILAFSTYGVYSNGDFAATGAKSFIEPHPTDPSKVIRFVSLEGNESGTYFRGSARIVNGSAVIAVPEEFRMVTDEDGLTVQLTPVGAAATMFVESEDLNQIVVRSNRDVKFHFQVNGIRRAYKDYAPIVEGQEFMPYSPSAVPLESYPAEIRQRLVANGTYNPDGSVNMETARRLGWDKLKDALPERKTEATSYWVK